MRHDDAVSVLDAYFRVPEVENDDWSETYEQLYPEPYWREFAEPGYTRIEIITKPGTDTFHGSFRMSFFDEALNARDPPARTTLRASVRMQ